MPVFRNVRTDNVWDVPEHAAASFRRSDQFVEEGADKVPSDTPDESPVDDTERPSQRDSKADWESWAQSQGYDTDGLTKADLMELG